MADRSKRHLEKVLRECAESGVPDPANPWRAIRERLSGQATGETQVIGTHTSEDRAADGPRNRRPLLVPDRPLGWVLAVLSVLILAAGAYAASASGPIRELIGNGLPGPGSPGSGEDKKPERSDRQVGISGVTYRLFRGAVPGGAGEEIGQTQTADGARVTLALAYADEEFVVVGIEARDLDGAREIEGYPRSVVLQPLLVGEEGANEAELPPRVDITDAGGGDFTNVDGMTQYPGAVAVFEAPEGLEAGKEHRFRLEVPLEEGGMLGRPGQKPDAGPFVFDFEVPVRPVPVIEVDQEATTKGITLTLERVVNSPARPQAVVCIDPPDDEHTWTPWLERSGMPVDAATAPRRLGDNCWARTMGKPVEGPSSVTVAYIHGLPRSASDPDEDGKEIRGPWTFEFEVPGP